MYRRVFLMNQPFVLLSQDCPGIQRFILVTRLLAVGPVVLAAYPAADRDVLGPSVKGSVAGAGKAFYCQTTQNTDSRHRHNLNNLSKLPIPHEF